MISIPINDDDANDSIPSSTPTSCGGVKQRLDKRLASVLALVTLLPFANALMGQQDEEAVSDSIAAHVLDSIVIRGRLDDLTGIASTASQGVVGFDNLRLRPLLREAELLETVPGMILTQHSGDGKSNQMFVRGFNLDHGTDFSTKVEGMQVNIPTHAHGHGYTDLNFIIPELVDRVEYKLGNYYADIGDFGSAGGAHVWLRRSLSEPLFLTSYGQDGFRRLVAAASGDLGSSQLLGGIELKGYDGPWTIPQGLRKISGIARYSWRRGDNLVSILALGYDNEWDSSDQIPSRLVDGGVIDRFAQVDSTLGGTSSRASISASWLRAGSTSDQRVDIYGIFYELDLYGNFTYFLDHPEGDQVLQRDDGRVVVGANLAHVQPLDRHSLTVGLDTRADFLDISLFKTTRRTVTDVLRSDEAITWATGVYLEVESEWSSLVRTVLGLRGDYHRFDVTSLAAEESGGTAATIVSPKGSLVLRASEETEVYLSGGLGFHSNDARAALRFSADGAGDAIDPLVRSVGAEIGLRASPAADWRSTLAGWTIGLDSELIFVGDAGTTEPSGGSRRFGLTWANFYRLSPSLYTDLDISFARARFRDLPKTENRIPGSMERVIAGGLTWEPEGDGPLVALRLRHFGEYPLIEDDTRRAGPTSLVSLNAGWVLGDLRISASVLNLFDEEASDIQYFYASRLRGEPAGGVDDLHFHPTEPRQVRVTASWGL